METLFRFAGWMLFIGCCIDGLCHFAASMGGTDLHLRVAMERTRSVHFWQIPWYGLYAWFVGKAMGWW